MHRWPHRCRVDQVHTGAKHRHRVVVSAVNFSGHRLSNKQTCQLRGNFQPYTLRPDAPVFNGGTVDVAHKCCYQACGNATSTDEHGCPSLRDDAQTPTCLQLGVHSQQSCSMIWRPRPFHNHKTHKWQQLGPSLIHFQAYVVSLPSSASLLKL